MSADEKQIEEKIRTLLETIKNQGPDENRAALLELAAIDEWRCQEVLLELLVRDQEPAYCEYLARFELDRFSLPLLTKTLDRAIQLRVQQASGVVEQEELDRIPNPIAPVMAAFAALRDPGALPELLKMLEEDYYREAARRALRGIGPGVGELLRARRSSMGAEAARVVGELLKEFEEA